MERLAKNLGNLIVLLGVLILPMGISLLIFKLVSPENVTIRYSPGED